MVLAARRTDALEETARLCRSAGGDALVVDTDVNLSSEVDALAQAALTYGRIGTARFALWATGRFVRNELGSAARRMRRWWTPRRRLEAA